MAYEVTATRKRPQVFEKLVGQQFVVSTIENAIESGRIAHAYLFSGPRGVGKTTSARLLAKALNCEKGPTAHPCGECASCSEIASGSSVDVIEIDGASNTSVNDIRVIKDEVLFPPQASRYKIYIIDEVHMLSNSAFNALLKTIEEPPEYIIFIFATTELQKVPATIRSRCQQFHFQLIGLEDIKACLKEACGEMGIQADEDALFWIAKEAAGSMRDAYTLFDQVASFSGDHITLAAIRDKLGLVGTDQIAALVSRAISGDRRKAQEDLASILSKGVSVEQCMRDFTGFFRSVLLLKEGIDSEELLGMRRQDIPQEVVDSLSNAQVEATLRFLMQSYREIRYSISPRFELELFVSRLSSLRFLTTPEELVGRLEAMKDDIAKGKATVVKEVQTVQVSPSVPPVARTEEPASPAPVQEVQDPRTPVQTETERPFETSTVDDIGCGEGEDDAEAEDSVTAIEETGLRQTPSPVEGITSYKDRLGALVEAGDESGVFAMGSCLSEVRDARVRDGVLCLETPSSYAHKVLGQNIAVVTRLVEKVTGFQGRIEVLLTQTREDAHNPMLDTLAKAFRGQIIIEKEDGAR